MEGQLSESSAETEVHEATLAVMEATFYIAHAVSYLDPTTGTLLRVIPSSHAYRLRDRALVLNLRMRLGLPPTPGLSHCPLNHRARADNPVFRYTVNQAHRVDKNHHLGCPQLIHSEHAATRRHDEIASLISKFARESHSQTFWQPRVSHCVHLSRRQNSRLSGQPPSESPANPSSGRQDDRGVVDASPDFCVFGNDQQRLDTESAEEWSEDVMFIHEEAQDHRQKRSLFADISIWGYGFSPSILVDVKIVSPTCISSLEKWRAFFAKPSPSSRTDKKLRTTSALLTRAEKAKTDYYKNWLTKTYREEIAANHRNLAATDDLFSLFSIAFVPAVLSIYGNIGPQMEALLVRLAARPCDRHLFPYLHPPQELNIFDSAPLKTRINLGRYKSLISVSLANSIDMTFSSNPISGAFESE